MAMARQFFDGNHRPAVVAPSFAPGTYNIPSDLAFTQGNPSAANFGDAWARVQQQYSQALPQPAPSAAWANEFKPAQTSLNESATKLDISQTNRELSVLLLGSASHRVNCSRSEPVYVTGNVWKHWPWRVINVRK